ncbi:MAG: CsbD family protein, partial [Actinobacteria bacterium]|nr:CsbD family protein [Actinomycetota bacterium]
KGTAKEVIGQAIGDEQLEAEGTHDRKTGEVKQKVENVKDKVEDAVDKVADTFRRT